MTGVCTCGHPWDLHEHYRVGTDCAGVHLSPDGVGVCRCPRYTRPNAAAVLARAVAAAVTARADLIARALTQKEKT